MKLTPKQRRVQEKIVLAVHKGLTLEEAKEKELHTDGCLVRHGFVSMSRVLGFGSENKPIISLYGGIADVYTIIGLPPSLSRVMNVLKNLVDYIDILGPIGNEENKIRIDYVTEELIYHIERTLLNPDGTSSTLRDQSEETQDKIALLLGWKDENSL